MEMDTNMTPTVLVTGGCGFIGSNFIQFLLDHTDYKIVNIDSLTYAGASNLNWNPSRYIFYRADIGDTIVGSILQKEKPDFVVNFAAETHVDRSIANPDSFVNTNLLSTYKLVCMVNEYAQTNPYFRFIHISTDEVYGDLERDEAPFTELSPYLPNSPYSATKAGGDHLIRAFIKTFGLPAIITHCSNNYGPRQFPEKLMPIVILKAFNNKSIPLYGKGDAIRDWLYVEDHCRALYRVMLDGKIGSVYNIGGNSERPNVEVVKLILSIMNRDESLITYVQERKGHDFRYAINTEKIEKELGWKASTSFEDGVYKTVEWYLSNIEWVTSCVNLESF
jgi:dTDP-glucose 4,6-dehydratase